MCVIVYTCARVCVCIAINTPRKHVRMCVWLYACMCVCMYVCMCVCVYVCMCVYEYVCTCKCVYVYVRRRIALQLTGLESVCVCMCVCVYVCICVLLQSTHIDEHFSLG